MLNLIMHGAIVLAIILIVLILFLPSIRVIGPTEVGLVIKRFGKKLPGNNVIAFNGEAGYQAELLMPGWRWKFWMIYSVKKFPWIQVPTGGIGAVVAQIGQPLDQGAKSGIYKEIFGDFTDLKIFMENGGQKGRQRSVLRSGTSLPIHPVAFLVLTEKVIYGLPVDPELEAKSGHLTPESFGLQPEELRVTIIAPQPITERDEDKSKGEIVEDIVGVVTTLDGPPLEPGHIACRVGGFGDIEKLEKEGSSSLALIESIIADKNTIHNNFQDFQKFLDNGGRMGLQHDVLRYGAYNLNPFLVKVEKVPMLVVKQGEVAVIKSYEGLPTQDTSGSDFKFGSLVRPGHRGIWEEPLRTGKYAANPRIYDAQIVPTSIINLSWSEMISKAHFMDSNLKSIQAKSREGFVFTIDLQVQIHIPDIEAARVISMVGTIRNLVEEILHPAVGNYFRDILQSMSAISFIETRKEVQEQAHKHIKEKLQAYKVETPGAYIQDVVLPEALIQVTKDREIANQQIQTFQKQTESQKGRLAMEQAKGEADQQANLAKSKIDIQIKKNQAEARKAEADGESEYLTKVGAAKAVEVEKVGLARATAYEKQVSALGQFPTALINAATVLAEHNIKIVPEILVMGGGKNGGDALSTTLAAFISGKLPFVKPADPKAETTT